MDIEIRLVLDDCSNTKALFTCNGENNTESVGYEMKKKKKKATIPKTTNWCLLLWSFLGNNIRPMSKRNNSNFLLLFIPPWS